MALLAPDVMSKISANLGQVLDRRSTDFLTLRLKMRNGVALAFGYEWGKKQPKLACGCVQFIELDSGLERLRFRNVVCEQEQIGHIRSICRYVSTLLLFADTCLGLVVRVKCSNACRPRFGGIQPGSVVSRV